MSAGLVTCRPVEIEVRREWRFVYSAYILREDDNDEGMGTEQGPYYGLRHRRAWERAYRAAGRRLWPRLEDGSSPAGAANDRMRDGKPD